MKRRLENLLQFLMRTNIMTKGIFILARTIIMQGWSLTGDYALAMGRPIVALGMAVILIGIAAYAITLPISLFLGTIGRVTQKK